MRTHPYGGKGSNNTFLFYKQWEIFQHVVEVEGSLPCSQQPPARWVPMELM
jgi:hypothetical protein